MLSWAVYKCHGFSNESRDNDGRNPATFDMDSVRMVHKVSRFRVLSLAIEDDPAILLTEGPQNELSAKGSVVSWRGPVYVSRLLAEFANRLRFLCLCPCFCRAKKKVSKFADVSESEASHPLLPLEFRR